MRYSPALGVAVDDLFGYSTVLHSVGDLDKAASGDSDELISSDFDRIISRVR